MGFDLLKREEDLVGKTSEFKSELIEALGTAGYKPIKEEGRIIFRHPMTIDGLKIVEILGEYGITKEYYEES